MKWYSDDIRDLSDAEYKKWYSLMSEDKQRRVDRFRFVDDKKRTIAGDLLARTAISEWSGISRESIIFDKNEYGKPIVKDLAVEFNISHSGNMVVCAVNDKPIGIDIEQVRLIDLNVAKRICSENELAFLFGHIPNPVDYAQIPDMATLIRFFEIWTTKEALAKCVGTGIAEFRSDQYLSSLYEIERLSIDGYVATLISLNV